jgi:hypothetical protein
MASSPLSRPTGIVSGTVRQYAMTKVNRESKHQYSMEKTEEAAEYTDTCRFI